MAIENNSFCWNGIASSDLESAKAFYAATIGWNAAEHSFPNGETSTMFFAADRPRAHLRSPEPGEPDQWTSYLRVEDVDASVAAAVKAGGSEQIPPTNIAPGRFAAVRSPSGAGLCLFREADDAADNAPSEVGSVNWTELQSNDVERDLPWLIEAFGFETDEMPTPDGGTYYMLNSGGKPRAGLCAAFKADVAGRWLNWIQVADVDETIKRTQAGGGAAVTDPSNYPGVGRMAIAKDPTGAVFGIITPNAD